MKVGIVPNSNKINCIEFSKILADYLLGRKHTPVFDSCFSNILSDNSYFFSKDIFGLVEFVLVLGGDGTMLNAAKSASVNKKPLMGINLGKLGYLTPVSTDSAFDALDKVLTGDYKTEKRIMIQSEQALALNEVMLAKEYPSKPIEFSLYINNEFICRYQADGLIVSTPTGSTAYNLSAGGPIVKPESDVIIITPVCPHNMLAKPFIIPSSDVVHVKNEGNSKIIVSADGAEFKTLEANGEIDISKSQHITEIINTHGLGFYDIVRKKLVW